VTSRETFGHVLQPCVAGLLVEAGQKADVGDTLRVKLIRTHVQPGFIDFRPRPAAKFASAPGSDT
jgi:hypothetical protein